MYNIFDHLLISGAGNGNNKPIFPVSIKILDIAIEAVQDAHIRI